MMAGRNEGERLCGRSDRAAPPHIRAWSVRPVFAAVLVAGMALSIAHPGLAQDTAAPIAVDRYAAEIAEAARRFGLPSSWIDAVLWRESRGDPAAISPKSARGLMQIMPATWDALATRYRLGSNPFDPRANVHAGAAYLREMYDRYGDLALALAAYNAGPGRVDEWLRTGRPLPRETRDYVADILPRIGNDAVSNASPTDPSTAPIFVPRSTRNVPSEGGRTTGVAIERAQPSSLFVDRSAPEDGP